MSQRILMIVVSFAAASVSFGQGEKPLLLRAQPYSLCAQSDNSIM